MFAGAQKNTRTSEFDGLLTMGQFKRVFIDHTDHVSRTDAVCAPQPRISSLSEEVRSNPSCGFRVSRGPLGSNGCITSGLRVIQAQLKAERGNW